MNSNLQNNYENVKTSLKNYKPTWWLSWPVIVVASIIFWPVGLFLIWRRTVVDKKAALFSGKIVGICGWSSLGLALMGFLISIDEGFQHDDITTITFLVLAGIGLVI